MGILDSRKSKLAIAGVIFLIALSVVVFELVYVREQSPPASIRHGVIRHAITKPEPGIPAGSPPASVQPGVIQHVITKLEPVIPSGRILEVDGNSTKTIQSIIDSAEAGDKVLVKPGVYTESLTLKNGIIFQGEDCNSVTIQGDMRIGPVLKINGCDTTQVSKLTLRHYNTETLEDNSKGNWPVIQIDNSGALLEHLVICDSASDGIRIANDPTHLNHVLIADCTINDNRSYGILVTGNGNVEMKNNTCINNKANGIYFKDFADGIMTGNVCKGNAHNGIAMQDNAAVDILDNTFCENKWSGIIFASKSPFKVSHNKCFDNGSSGIDINSQVNVLVAGNTCHRNGINGIYLRNGVTGTVNGNICTENKWHGISVDKLCAPHIDDNQCFNNKKCGINDDGPMLGQNKTDENGAFCCQEVQMYLRAEAFDELEKMASRIRKEKRRFDNGGWQLEYFYSSFRIGYGSQPFEDNINLCEKWVSKYPSSVTPRIALANSFDGQGWHLRGGGYSNTVSPAAWEPFEQYLSKARDVLKDAEKLNADDPSLYSLWISVAMGLHKRDEIEAAFQKGVVIEPTYFPLYDARGFAYLPKWYGQPGQYERLAREAAESTKDKIGQSLYFLLACSMTRQVKDVDQFRKSSFDYTRIKQGMKDFAKQFPHFLDTETSNRLCFMACAAGNKEDARDYFLDIEDQWNEKLWQNYETFTKYKNWAKNREEE